MPEAMEAPIKDLATKNHCLTYLLSDTEGRTVLQRREVVGKLGDAYQTIVKRPAVDNLFSLSFDSWWIGPMWWSGFLDGHHVVLRIDSAIAVPQEDLRKVAKTTVFLEEDTKHER